MQVRFVCAVLLILFASNAAIATTRKVLFIGNSYTSTNNMPLIVQHIATSLGDTLIYGVSDPGGYTLEMHCSFAPTTSLIFSQPWDVVVLQEQSELPAFPAAQVDTQVYPYARRLDSMIHANDSCTQTMFLMTWGHANGDPLNCAAVPEICTYAGMQLRLRQSYLQMTLDNNAIVAPVGAAWEVMMDSFATSIWLYITDSVHPNINGSYLESCVLYSSIFHKRTWGCSDTEGISVPVASIIQRISDKEVFDSLYQWQEYGHYPFAGFTDSCAGDSAEFISGAVIPQNMLWNFGDGAFSGPDTLTSVMHRFDTSATYTVSLTASNSCFSETMVRNVPIHCIASGMEKYLPINNLGLIVRSLGNGLVSFEIPEDRGLPVLEFFEVYDMNGRIVRKYSNHETNFVDSFDPGFYIARTFSNSGSVPGRTKFVVY